MDAYAYVTTKASRNRIGACTRSPASRADLAARLIGEGIFLFLLWLTQLVGLPNGRVALDGSPGRTDDGRVVRDFKVECKSHCRTNKGFSNRDITILSMNKTQKYLRH